MKRCECENPYRQLYEEENIQVGDILSLDPISNRVKLSFNKFLDKDEQVIGVCEKIENNMIYVANTGILDVNVIGLICIGDKLTTSEQKGKARAIKYSQDETQFTVRSIGKVIGLYNTYDRAKVLLDIE